VLSKLKYYLNSFTHFIYPNFCEGCHNDVFESHQLLCATCLAELPETNFTSTPENTIEKKFYGRLPLATATAAYYFTKDSLMQHLMHQLKYKNQPEIGVYLGKLLGFQLQASNKYAYIDGIVPLPLNPKREFKRGYNQAALIAEGVAMVLNKPIIQDAIIRNVFTQTQTVNNRVHRLANIDGAFAINNAQAVVNKHILLVDDIITTGATLEACGTVILEQNCKALSIAAVAYTA
jgi:ComF family protein